MTGRSGGRRGGPPSPAFLVVAMPAAAPVAVVASPRAGLPVARARGAFGPPASVSLAPVSVFGSAGGALFVASYALGPAAFVGRVGPMFLVFDILGAFQVWIDFVEQS